MSLTRKIAHNTIFRVAGRAFGLVAGVFIVGFLTRYLGQDGYGRYTTSIAFLQFFAIVADFGLYQILMQLISQPKANESKIIGNIMSLRIVLAIIILGLACLIAFLIPTYSIEIKMGICVASLAIFATLLNQIIVAVYQAHLKLGGVSIAEFIGRFLNLGLIILIVNLNLGFYATLWALVAANIFQVVFNWFRLKTIATIKLFFDFKFWKKVIKLSWPIGLSILFSMLYFKMDTIILSIFRPESEVGIYGASYQLVEVLNSFPALFVGIIMPILSQAWANNNKGGFKKILQRAFDSLIIIVVPLVFGGFILANKIMVLVAGKNFYQSGDVLRILIFAIGFLFIGQLFGHAIVAINKQRKMMWNYLGVAILGVSAYLIFIPKYSYWAAASITIVTEFLIAILGISIVYHEMKGGLKINILWKAILAAIAMSLVIYYLLAWHVLILILLGGIIYFAVLYLLGAINKNQILEIIKYKK